MSEHKHHIVSYKTHLLVLLSLLALTFLTVVITSFEMGPYNTTAALIVAGLKAAIVLGWFMHLKFDNKFYAIMVALVLTLFALVVIVTFFDYSYR